MWYIYKVYMCVCVKPKYKNKQLFYVISSVSYQMETITDVITLVDATFKIKKCNYSIISFSYSHSKSYILATVYVL
jgi:mannose/fructose/N-acetylgalactosamine-specific phosphotransferase system component IIB